MSSNDSSKDLGLTGSTVRHGALTNSFGPNQSIFRSMVFMPTILTDIELWMQYEDFNGSMEGHTDEGYTIDDWQLASTVIEFRAAINGCCASFWFSCRKGFSGRH